MEQGRIDNGAGAELAWQRLPGRGPCVVFLPGFRSDMAGDKAKAIAAWCARDGRASLLFDYSGHGQSGGRFENGTISRWLADVLFVVDRLAPGPLLLVGSSMGGWLAVLAALARPGRVAGLVGIAAAPDFTQAMWDMMAPEDRAVLMERGMVHRPSALGEPYAIARALIEDGRRHLVLGGPIAITAPVRLLHGQADAEVPWETSVQLAARISGPDIQVTLVKDGGHRLSRPRDLALLQGVLRGFLENGA